jgi:hypothetical protein
MQVPGPPGAAAGPDRRSCKTSRYCTGRRQPSNSRSRTPCSRSCSHRVAPPPAASRGTADIAGDAVAAAGADHSSHVKPRHGQVERLLILGSTGHRRPAAVVGPFRWADRKQPFNARAQLAVHARRPQMATPVLRPDAGTTVKFRGRRGHTRASGSSARRLRAGGHSSAQRAPCIRELPPRRVPGAAKVQARSSTL